MESKPFQKKECDDHPKYGRYVWIELTYNNTYDVVANDTVLKNCKSLASAKRWVSTNL